MKKLLIIPLCMLMFGCGPDSSQITAAVSLGTSTGLGFVTDKTKQAQIADWIDAGATAVRQIPDSGTEADLIAAITKMIPPNVQAEYPSLLAHILPVAIAVYKVTHNAQAIAAGLEQGAACCITGHK